MPMPAPTPMSMSNHTSPEDHTLAHGLPEVDSASDHDHEHDHHHHHHSPSHTNNIQYAASTPQAHSHPSFPGASVYTPTSTPSASLNPRSCVTCRRRKVRCDKHMPCSNCRRAQIPCIFPAPGRAPRRPRPKDPNAPTTKQPSSEREIELMKRLRKLEGIVEELSGQIEVETAKNHSSSGNSPEAIMTSGSDYHNTPDAGAPRLDRADSVLGAETLHGVSPPSRMNSMTESRMAAMTGHGPPTGPPAKHTERANGKFGRLVINDHGKTRYISSAFWSKINDELDQLRNETERLTDNDSDVSDDEGSIIAAATEKRSTVDHHAFVFGYRSADVDLRSLHPLPSQIPFMWQIYQENVDPVVKVLHAPTIGKLIKETRSNLDSLTPANESLMFAIYYAAVTSLDEDDVKANFGVEKDKLISQYRFALEQALAKAEFLDSNDLVVLQAFILFLVLVRRHDKTRFAWTLTGLAIRMSQSMGLHRDGSAFSSLTPFEIEMRRRLFWALCVLDLRSAEDQGTELTIMDKTFDTQFPANINDYDISPDSTELPQSREGTTDMTFSLIRYEICSLARRIYNVSSTITGNCPRDCVSTINEREAALKEAYERVETKYLGNNQENPMYWVAANIARVICAKMTLVIYQPILFSGPNNKELSDDARIRIFNAATEIFEYNYQLNSDPRSKQWRWLFHTYTQWHAVAYVLMEVARRPWSAAVERAWSALNSVFTSPKPMEFERIGDAAMWLPLKKIYMKAKKHREAEIERLKAAPAAAQALELEDRSKEAPKNFTTMPGSVKAALANERWRKLVNAPKLPPDVKNQPPLQLMPGQAISGGADLTDPQQQAAMVNANVNGLDDSEFASARAMDLVDQALSQETFSPHHLWPIIGMGNDIENAAARQSGPMFGYLAGDSIPRQDTTLANYSNNVDSNRVAPPGTGGMAGGLGNVSTDPRMQPGPTPLVDALKTSSNPPPWMWSDGPVFNSPAATVGSSTNSGVGLGGGVPGGNNGGIRFPLPDIQPEDIDIDMGEDFNWQDWGQSLMESTGSALGSGWSAHDI